MTWHNKSLIFTDDEIEQMENKEKGYPINGNFSHRVKPKIQEILKQWIPMKKRLEKIIK